MTKIYTKTGDKGKTSLFDGTRVFKSDIRVDTYGTVDELNSMIGLIIAEIQNSKGKMQKHKAKVKSELENIQNDLLDIGSYLAYPDSPPVLDLEKRPEDFEKLIDAWAEKMPPLSDFILPGGSKAGAAAHLARTVTRRTERRIISLMQREDIDETVIKYFNRLSDLFFTMARFINYKDKQKETKWRKK